VSDLIRALMAGVPIAQEEDPGGAWEKAYKRALASLGLPSPRENIDAAVASGDPRLKSEVFARVRQAAEMATREVSQ
jgi:hypothetical protein